MAGKHSKKLFGDDGISVLHLSEKGVKMHSGLSLPFKIIIVAVVCCLILSAVFIGSYFMSGWSHGNLLQEAAEVFDNASDKTSAFKTLAKENPDIIGWLKIDGANINYAVCQGDDDIHYKSHNQLGEESRHGALFLSSQDSFERKDNDRNITIFGNNMKDGTMFGNLKKYRNLNFYKQNPTLDLYYQNNSQRYIVFAVMLTGSSFSAEGSDYNPFKSHFFDKTDFDEWYSETSQRSLLDTTVELDQNDNILTLVTTADDFENARLVVMAKEITEWDASHTDVSGATVNSKIKYPKIWYENKGLEYPY